MNRVVRIKDVVQPESGRYVVYCRRSRVQPVSMETPSVLISSGLHGERGSRRTTVEGGRMAGAYKRIKKPYFTCR
ncbi:hypothetical protein NDU88_003311 [Pleurodeles waltl]|uniref:Uncharacterized protein n=1 Tax=Pleurodeles waltl TaxID=8319 RepID=A0AAV7LFH1_PLEWA|nr:hypothetical protein NDU88_003311 [Pleurodeles waltl]